MNEYQSAIRSLDAMFSSNRHLDECFDENSSPLAQQICYGVVRHFFYLDELIDHLLKKPLPDKHSDLHCLLMAGLYSMEHLNRPAHASVNAAVETTIALKKPWAKGLVNGILRRYGREGEALRKKITNKSDEARLNHPAWLIEMIQSAWPEQQAQIFAANQTRAPMTLRINRRKGTAEDYLARLADEKIEARHGGLTESAVILTQPVAIGDLPGFFDGLVSIQDEAPQLAAGFLNLVAGQSVLDACAAPGGKTCHILENEAVTVTAIDRDRKRTPMINDNLERLSLAATVVASDLLDYETEQTFDRILLDVPCSATGIIRRHPDINLLRTKSDVDKLSDIQHALIIKAFELLSSGGELLYSTCSILPQENDAVIRTLLNQFPEAESLPISIHCDDVTRIATTFGIQLLPTTNEHDGFYYARLKRTAA